MIRRVLAGVRTLRRERRELGWRGLLRKRGWRLVLILIGVYLVRDVLLYIVLPLAVAMRIAR